MPTSEKIKVNSLQANTLGGLDEIERVTKRKRRHYVVHEQELPSVTTILQDWPKPALVAWAKKISREAYATFLENHLGELITADLIEDGMELAKNADKDTTARDLGTMAHELISMELLGQTVSVPPELDYVMKSFHEWQKDEHLTLVDTETAIYAPDYAGTIDALFKRDNGAFLLVDFKTSNHIYPEHDVQVFSYMDAIANSVEGSIDIEGQVVRLGKEESDFEVLEINNYRDRLGKLWRGALAFHTALEEDKIYQKSLKEKAK
jgi:hypothetical protein